MKPHGTGFSTTAKLSLLLCAIHAATAAHAADEDSATQLQKVVVNGTRQTGRTVAESLATIQAISNKELQSSGASSQYGSDAIAGVGPFPT